MSISKTQLPLESRPVLDSEPQKKPEEELPNPQPLLDALKEKYRQFVKLRDEGFIGNDHQSIEFKLKQAIVDLENLMPKLTDNGQWTTDSGEEGNQV